MLAAFLQPIGRKWLLLEFSWHLKNVQFKFGFAAKGVDRSAFACNSESCQ